MAPKKTYKKYFLHKNDTKVPRQTRSDIRKRRGISLQAIMNDTKCYRPIQHGQLLLGSPFSHDPQRFQPDLPSDWYMHSPRSGNPGDITPDNQQSDRSPCSEILSEPWLVSSQSPTRQLLQEAAISLSGINIEDQVDLHSVRSYSHSPGEDNASIATESLNYIGPSAPPSLNPSDNDTDSDNESVDTDELNASGNKIYDNAKITVQESVVLLYAYIFRHHTTRAATEDLMKVLQHFLPSGVKSLPRSLYLLQKNLHVDFDRANKHFYCPTCQGSVQFDGRQREKCQFCKTMCVQKDLNERDSYFYLMDMRPILRYILEIPQNATEVLTTISKRDNNVASDFVQDVVDGTMYKALALEGYDISCQINTDGVKLFKSGDSDVWPIFISINELSYKRRRKFTSLVGLWFGNHKPNMSTYLRPFIRHCNEFVADPLAWKHQGQTYKSRVYFPLCTADSVARPALQGFKQFNGFYGCPWCVCPGERPKGTNKLIYTSKCLRYERRTDASVKEQLPIVEEIVAKKRHQDDAKGIIRSSPFLSLHKFDMIEGFPYDYMHGALLGVVKHLTGLLFDSTQDMEYNVSGRAKESVDERWRQVRVSTGTDRRVRGLESTPLFKAHEWKTWLLFWIPVLKGNLPNNILALLSKFTLGVLLLLQDSVSREDIRQSRLLLKNFCKTVEEVFGPSECTFNIHILSHISTTVEMWGPLWAYSLFQYESANGRLRHYFNGPHKVITQIVQQALIHQELLTTRDTLNGSQDLLFFVDHLLTNQQTFSRYTDLGNGITLAGPRKAYSLNVQELHSFEGSGVSTAVKMAWCYKHIFIRGCRLDIPPESLQHNLSLNCIFTTDSGGLYYLDHILLHEQRGFLLARSVRTTPHLGPGLDTFIFKVTAVGKRIKTVAVECVLGFKYHAMLNSSGELAYLVKVPNTRELE